MEDRDIHFFFFIIIIITNLSIPEKVRNGFKVFFFLKKEEENNQVKCHRLIKVINIE